VDILLEDRHCEVIPTVADIETPFGMNDALVFLKMVVEVSGGSRGRNRVCY